MQELHFVAVSEDGRYAVLGVPGRSARFMLPIDERLRAVALGQTSRLVQYEIEVESPLRPKEIQARIRAGETVEEIADAAGIAVERVRWFEGPVLAERAYMADQAQTASVRRHGDSSPGPRLGEIVAQRLKAIGADPEDAQWDAKKRDDGSWKVQLTFASGDRRQMAEWIFDPRRRHVLPADDNAARMSLPGAEPPQFGAPSPGEATVTQLAPRLSNAPGYGAIGRGAPSPAGSAGHGQGSWARHDRPSPGRSATADHGAPRPQSAAVPAPSVPAPSVPAPSVPAPSVPAPSVPAPSVPAGADQRGEASRRSAAERSPVMPATTREPAQAPAVAAGDDCPAAPVPAAATAAQAGPAGSAEPAAEQAGRQGRKAARGRRSSVPSWDEIMFGSSRQRD